MLATLLPPAPLPSPEPAPPPAPVTPSAPTTPANQPPRRTLGAKRWRLAGLLAVALAAAAILSVALYPRSHPVAAPGSGRVAAATAARDQAAAWVASNVGHNILVACEVVACADLAQHGFPASGLNVMQSTAPDLYGSQVIVATASVRSQFGYRLAEVFAPEVLASFGTGANRVDIRVIATDGPAAFRTAMNADARARKSAGAQLLARSTVTAIARARSELAAGRVDSRLLTVLAFLASQQPIDVLRFGAAAEGASPGVPLRIADLAAADPAHRLDSADYRRSLISLLRSEIPLYAPMSVSSVTLPSGQRALQITYAAPSPLGLLS